MDDGWYRAWSPVITAIREADSGDKGTVPLSGASIFKVGGQPMDAQVQTFYNVARPDFGPDWSIRFQLQFLFPK